MQDMAGVAWMFLRYPARCASPRCGNVLLISVLRSFVTTIYGLYCPFVNRYDYFPLMGLGESWVKRFLGGVSSNLELYMLALCEA